MGDTEPNRTAVPHVDIFDGVPSVPWGADGPVFNEPWQAQAFAMVVHLHAREVFTWVEWASTLSRQIRLAQGAGDPDLGDTYYLHWLAALETIVAEKGVTEPAHLQRYRRAWQHAVDRTPHGSPIELSTEDLRAAGA